MMQSDKFMQVIEKICRIASTKFMKAVVEVGYTEELYNEEEYETLEKVINQVSQDFMQQVFNV